MQESCTYGSVRGAPSNGRPYRNRDTTNLSMSPLVGSPPTEKSERKRTDTRSAGPFPRGTDGSNPVPSSSESTANPTSSGADDPECFSLKGHGIARPPASAMSDAGDPVGAETGGDVTHDGGAFALIDVKLRAHLPVA